MIINVLSKFDMWGKVRCYKHDISQKHSWQFNEKHNIWNILANEKKSEAYVTNEAGLSKMEVIPNGYVFPKVTPIVTEVLTVIHPNSDRESR